MEYKFQRLEIYRLSLEYVSLNYDITDKLPSFENFNLKSQLTRAATSIALNIAEGSTGQSDPEQSRFLGMALRSLVETVACHDLIELREYLGPSDLRRVRDHGSKLFAKIQTMKRYLGRSSLQHQKEPSTVGGRRSYVP